jgi:peroxiredoxin
MKTTPTARRSVNEVLTPFTLTTLTHDEVHVPDAPLTHLQFRRFAGCPVCNLHLRTFAKGVAQLDAAGVRTIAFFHSTRQAMLPYQGDLPFPVVPDPERHWYQLFGVERSPLGLLHPSVMWAGLKGLASVPSNALAGEGGHDGLPADFLIDTVGRIRGVSYGSHANDQWSLTEVLDRALAIRATA